MPDYRRYRVIRVARGERGIWQSSRVLLTPLTCIHVGSGAFGNMRFGMMRIMPRMSIIAISTPLSMAEDVGASVRCHAAQYAALLRPMS